MGGWAGPTPGHPEPGMHKEKALAAGREGVKGSREAKVGRNPPGPPAQALNQDLMKSSVLSK